MGPLSGVVMVAAGAVCLGGAVRSRHWLGIVASALMLAAMVDSAYGGVVAPIVWCGVLVLAGMLLGLELRRGPRATAAAGAAGVPGVAGVAGVADHAGARLHRAVMVAGALAYPACAWLLLGHGGAAGAPTGSGAESVAAEPGGHAGHGGSGTLTGTLPLGLTVALAAVLGALTLVAIRRRRGYPAAEAGGMSAMLLAMLVGHG